MMHWTPSMLSRTMHGQRTTLDTEAATILGLCGISGTPMYDIVQFCSPHQDMSLTLPADQQWPVYLAHASEAARLVEFQPCVIPWLLQTPDYTRALLYDGHWAAIDKVEIDTRQTARCLLDIPRVDILLYEGALRTPLLDAATMSDQLQYLLMMSFSPGCSVRVVPFGCGLHAGQHGGFTVLEFADHAPVVYRENHTTGVLLRPPATRGHLPRNRRIPRHGRAGPTAVPRPDRPHRDRPARPPPRRPPPRPGIGARMTAPRQHSRHGAARRHDRRQVPAAIGTQGHGVMHRGLFSPTPQSAA
jgi:hypothetical protein